MSFPLAQHFVEVTAPPRLEGEVQLPGSKSEANRLLVLAAQVPGLAVEGLPIADDVNRMALALQAMGTLALSPDRKATGLGLHAAKTGANLDCGEAGTVARFLLALCAHTPGEWVLDGNPRLRERPHGPLLAALEQAGAQFSYTHHPQCLPVSVQGQAALASPTAFTVDASLSSQYLSALLLLAPSLALGSHIALIGSHIASESYVLLTLQQMASLGYSWVRTATGFRLQAKPTAAPAQPLAVPADWSSAAYWLALAALGPTDLRLRGLPPLSAHPDRVLLELFQAAGLGVRWSADVLHLTHNGTSLYLPSDLDCSAFPDQAQTLAVYALAVGQEIRLRGLHTLRGKETDRLLALATEINRLAPGSAHADTDQASLHLHPAHFTPTQPIHTWNDHRMALAFSLLSRGMLSPRILAPEVVNKSYPAYWKHLRQLGFSLRFAV